MQRAGTGWTWSVGFGIIVLAAVGCEQLPWGQDAEESMEGAATEPVGSASSPIEEVFVPMQDQVAKVQGAAISTTDVELALFELQRILQSAGQEWTPLPVEDNPDQLDLGDVVTGLIDSELKARDLRSRGVDRQSDFRGRLGYVMRSFYAREWDEWQFERARPTEQAVSEFYEQNKGGFREPERIHVRQIAMESLSEAENIRTRVVQGEDFGQLARSFSHGPAKDRGGDIGWCLRRFDRDRLAMMGGQPTEIVFFEQLEPVAFALQDVGQVSQPVKGPDGQYYLVQLEERTAASQLTEVEVHDTIRELLTIQAMQQRLEELRADGQVTRFPEHLDQVEQ